MIHGARESLNWGLLKKSEMRQMPGDKANL